MSYIQLIHKHGDKILLLMSEKPVLSIICIGIIDIMIVLGIVLIN